MNFQFKFHNSMYRLQQICISSITCLLVQAIIYIFCNSYLIWLLRTTATSNSLSKDSHKINLPGTIENKITKITRLDHFTLQYVDGSCKILCISRRQIIIKSNKPTDYKSLASFWRVVAKFRKIDYPYYCIL